MSYLKAETIDVSWSVLSDYEKFTTKRLQRVFVEGNNRKGISIVFLVPQGSELGQINLFLIPAMMFDLVEHTGRSEAHR